MDILLKRWRKVLIYSLLFVLSACDSFNVPLVPALQEQEEQLNSVNSLAVAAQPDALRIFLVGDGEPDWDAGGLVVTGTKGNGGQVIVPPRAQDEKGYTVSGFDSSSPKICALTVYAPGWNGTNDTTQEAKFYVSIVSRHGLMVLYSIENFAALDGSVSAGVTLAQKDDVVELTVSPAAGKTLSPGSLRYIQDTNGDGSFDDATESVSITGMSFPMPARDVKLMAEFIPGLMVKASLDPENGGSVIFGDTSGLVVRGGDPLTVMMPRQATDTVSWRMQVDLTTPGEGEDVEIAGSGSLRTWYVPGGLTPGAYTVTVIITIEGMVYSGSFPVTVLF
jgi:hypothetical protein